MLLNRRHLRIKVLQELYAFYQSDENDYVLRERELDKSIDKMHEQFVYWMSLFHELKHFAENRIEENRNKRLPSQEDLNPNLKFVNNRVFEVLAVNKELRRYIEQYKVSWEQETIKKLFNQIKECEKYKNYMADETSSFEDDQQFAVAMFKLEVANFELIHHILEEKSIFWLDDIDLICSMVIKTIKQLKPDADEFTPLPKLFKADDDEEDFYKTLFRKTIMRDEEISKLINSKTDNWELDRIAKMDVILMKMAVTEALEFKTVPLKVSLNEYIEISKFYSTPKSNGFINGILDRIFDELKKNGEIKKMGRGLLE